MKNWKIAIAIIVLGICFSVIDMVVFIPRFYAYSEAITQWAKSNMTTTPMPQQSMYGIDGTTAILSFILGYGGTLLISMGATYFVGLLIIRIARQLGYSKPDNKK